MSQMKAHGPLPCTLKVRLAKSKRGYSWHVPDVQSCSYPITNLPPSTPTVGTEGCFPADPANVTCGFDCIPCLLQSNSRPFLTTIE